MSDIRKSGSAALEMVWALLVLLAFATTVYRFSALAGEAHRVSISLEKDMERLMIENGRPACLEELGKVELKKSSSHRVFGGAFGKRLVFLVDPICRGW